MADPEFEYRTALEITLQWLETWRRTQNRRYFEDTLVCSRIARERFATLQRERVAGRNYRELVLIERQAELQAVIDEVRASIAECRELLKEWDGMTTALLPEFLVEQRAANRSS